MARNKKVKIDYQRKANLIAKYEVYKAEHKKLPVSEEEYQDLKDELLILESRYPSIKKMAEDLILRGTLNYDDGRVYTGAIKSALEQMPHGHGTMHLNNKEVNWSYIGDFKDGVFDGHGEFISEGCYSYVGEWKESHFNGKGVFADQRSNETYDGDFIKNNKHGYGIYHWDFLKYEGEFKNNEKNGKGIMTILKDSEGFKKGTIYKGSFKNSFLNGQCTITYPDGEISKGKWVKGKFIENK